MPIYGGRKYNYAILSRFAAYDFTHDKPYILVSIGEPGEERPALRKDPNRLDVLYLNFHDISNPNPELIGAIEAHPDHWKLMTKEQAEQVVAFVEKYKDRVDLIAAHCAAGISRSAGVIAAISLWLEGREITYNKNMHIPNTWVKSQIMRVLRELGL